MSETGSAGPTRLKKIAVDLNISVDTVVDHLKSVGITIEKNPMAKVTEEGYIELLRKFQPDKLEREKSAALNLTPTIAKKEEEKKQQQAQHKVAQEVRKVERIEEKPAFEFKVIDKIDLNQFNPKPKGDPIIQKAEEKPIIQTPHKQEVISEKGNENSSIVESSIESVKPISKIEAIIEVKDNSKKAKETKIEEVEKPVPSEIVSKQNFDIDTPKSGPKASEQFVVESVNTISKNEQVTISNPIVEKEPVPIVKAKKGETVNNFDGDKPILKINLDERDIRTSKKPSYEKEIKSKKAEADKKVAKLRESSKTKDVKTTSKEVVSQKISASTPIVEEKQLTPEIIVEHKETEFQKLDGLTVLKTIDVSNMSSGRVKRKKTTTPQRIDISKAEADERNRNQGNNQNQGFNRGTNQNQGFNRGPNTGQGFNQGTNQGGGFNRGGNQGGGYGNQNNNNQGTNQGGGYNNQNRQGGGFNQNNQGAQQGQGGFQNRVGNNNANPTNRNPNEQQRFTPNAPNQQNQGGFQNRGGFGNNQGGYQNRPGIGTHQGGNGAGGVSQNRPPFDPNRPFNPNNPANPNVNRAVNKTQGPRGNAKKKKIKVDKKNRVQRKISRDAEQQEMDNRILKVTEFITANEFASLMNVSVNQVITACFSLGNMVSINQRLDADTISILAEEFGFEIEFSTATEDEPSLEQEDNMDNMEERPPIVTIMGHVDHGKTSLLDYIRNATVVAGEAGGITQHIGAYEVTLPTGRKIAFLDTPGHEAFTAMRARGAKVTDIVIIVIAADDAIMPQTREAISHAQAAGVPIIFAFNKIDKANADVERIREQLSAMNILVEEWGGTYQSQAISAKKGLNIDLLLEKVLLQADILELQADADKRAIGTVVESALDKGKGIIATVMVQKGTLRVGDPILAGANFGKVKALMNERGVKIKSAGPSTPVQILGFDGAPTAGDKFYVPESEQVGKDLATRRKQLIREQGIKAKKHITLEEIGRRLKVGNFRELNLIIKGDVDGSVEALADSLLKLSTEEIQVNVIFKAVGQISESDVLLASASDAIIIGFQVRPSAGARKLAENEQIDIRLYSIIYQAIEEVKQAMEGMLAPTQEEKIIGNIEVRDVFKITKVGTIAGCYVTDGKIIRNNEIRLIRDGVVVYTGKLASLKRHKDDAKEVLQGYECGLGIENFNDIKVGDTIESYETIEVARKLA